MRRIFTTGFFLVFAARLVFAEGASLVGQPSPTTAPEISSKPEDGQRREQTTPMASPTTTTPVPVSDSTEIWSRPEPGKPRETLPPQSPPPYPYYYQRPVYHSEPDSGNALKEIGLTLGPPTIVNLNLGYWGPKSFPMLARFSGMYYGDTRGLELDLGYVFQRDAHLRQYVALSFVSWQLSTGFYNFWSDSAVSSYTDMFTGLGPTYGLNWNGFSLQVGVAFGQDVNVTTSPAGYYFGYGYRGASTATISQFEPQAIFQVGYTLLW